MTVKAILGYACDKGRWAEQLCAVCSLKGASEHGLFCDEESFEQHFRRLCDAGIEEKDTCVFMRIPQWEPGISKSKRLAAILRAKHPDLQFIPSFDELMLYEDKLEQAKLFNTIMGKIEYEIPDTITYELGKDDPSLFLSNLHHCPEGCELYPLVSKSRTGSASANVRLLHSESEAMKEFMQVHNGGIEIAAGHRRKTLQDDHLIWQEFIRGNDCDYRACINGQYIMLLRRDNRPNVPFASGSGKTSPITEEDFNTKPYITDLLDAAEAFFADYKNTLWCGVDLVYCQLRKKWMALEATLGWSADAYIHCTYFRRRRTKEWEPSEYHGYEQMKLLYEQIRDGAIL